MVAGGPFGVYARRQRVAAMLIVLAVLATAVPASAVPSTPRARAGGEPELRREVFGWSSRGRPLLAVHIDSRTHRRPILVVGCIHGTECAGTAVAGALVSTRPRSADLWVVANLNPDGYVTRTRLNGRGVDLNRNFPSGWRAIGRRWDPQYSGPRPFSEPETRAVRRLIERIRPRVTIWFHQPLGFVRAWGGSVPAARRFARLSGVPFRRLPWLAGTAPNWQNHRFRGTASFVVELPPGRLEPATARRYVRAVIRLARGTS